MYCCFKNSIWWSLYSLTDEGIDVFRFKSFEYLINALFAFGIDGPPKPNPYLKYLVPILEYQFW
jgi:hypothetical protein